MCFIGLLIAYVAVVVLVPIVVVDVVHVVHVVGGAVGFVRVSIARDISFAGAVGAGLLGAIGAVFLAAVVLVAVVFAFVGGCVQQGKYQTLVVSLIKQLTCSQCYCCYG